MDKTYIIQLSKKVIGKTRLEKSDPPMGVVSGLIDFDKIDSPYKFIKEYCVENKIILNTDYPEDKFIDTQVIPELKVYSSDGIEIKGVGNYLTGFDSEGFEITLLGIPYPEYEREFPEHVRNYENMNK